MLCFSDPLAAAACADVLARGAWNLGRLGCVEDGVNVALFSLHLGQHAAGVLRDDMCPICQQADAVIAIVEDP